jgi:hypothetical protein
MPTTSGKAIARSCTSEVKTPLFPNTVPPMSPQPTWLTEQFITAWW